MSKPRRQRGVFAGQPKSALVTWDHAPSLTTVDPENDEMRAWYLPERLRAAGFEELAQAFERIAARGDPVLNSRQRRELFLIGDMRAVSRAALLIAGHMSGPALRFGGRPPRDQSRFAELLEKGRARVENGEDRRAVAAALVEAIYANGRAGHDLPATAKACREKLNRALRAAAQ